MRRQWTLWSRRRSLFVFFLQNNNQKTPRPPTAPDVDGRVVEDFAVAVPAAVGGAAAAGRVVSADVAEDLMLGAAGAALAAQVQQLQVRVALAVARGEAEAAHAVHLHEGQVEL